MGRNARRVVTECRLIRGGSGFRGKQGLDYLAGVSAESAGATAICMHLLEIPPGASAKPHYHVAHETAIFALEGVAEMRHGPKLEQVMRIEAGDFVYIPEDDTYRCPAGETLTWRFTSVEKGMTLHSYWTTKCATCPLKDQCTSSKQPRRVKRWEHEAVIDAMQERLDRKPDAMRIRRATVEHPFGTLKAWMGATHFKMKTLERVKTEMSLHVLAYNLKRVIAILGPQPLMEAMRA